MNISNIKKIPKTDIGKMIGDVYNLDWLDFEKINEDIVVGSNINNEIWFLFMRYEIELSRTKKKSDYQVFYQIKENFFKTNHDTLFFIEPSKGLNEDQQILLQDILKGKVKTLEEKHNPISENYIGKKIALPEVWKKKKAVSIIERNWLICRYDPNYKMCEKVLMNNINLAYKEYCDSQINNFYSF